MMEDFLKKICTIYIQCTIIWECVLFLFLEILSDESRSSFSPRLSPDGKKLIYFDNEIGGPHYQCSRLMLVWQYLV